MYGVRMSLLYKQLGFKHSKVPKAFTGEFPQVALRNQYDESAPPMCVADLIVKAADRKKHRIYAKCPTCGKIIPVGRLHQHMGTGNCK